MATRHAVILTSSILLAIQASAEYVWFGGSVQGADVNPPVPDDTYVPVTRRPGSGLERGVRRQRGGRHAHWSSDGSSLVGRERGVGAREAELTTREMQPRRFDAVARQLRGRIDSIVKIGKVSARVEVAVSSEGLRIELSEDEKGETFFPFGSSEMKPAGRIALNEIARELTALENPVIIEGTPMPRRTGASITRTGSCRPIARTRRACVLLQEGLPSYRVTEVTGLADRQLKYPEDPLRASNRRISIRLPFVLPPSLPQLPVRQTGPAG